MVAYPRVVPGMMHSGAGFFTICLLILVAVTPVSGIDPGTDWTAQQWYEEGLSHAKYARHQDALNAYDRALALDPAHARAWLARGVSLYRISRFGEAIISFDKAVQLNPALSTQAVVYRSEAEQALYPAIPSGSILAGTTQPGWKYLWIDNSQGLSDLLVVFTPYGHRGAVAAVYVRKGYSHRIDEILPDGSYTLYLEFGTQWNATSRHFDTLIQRQKFLVPIITSGSLGYPITIVPAAPYSSWVIPALQTVGPAEFPRV